MWVSACPFAKQPRHAFSLSLIPVLKESLPEDSLKIEVVNIQSLQSLCQQVLVSFVI
jgi:hypothetical protein